MFLVMLENARKYGNQEIIHDIEQRIIMRSAIGFFGRNLGEIEINMSMSGKLDKQYFPILPYCSYFKHNREQFNRDVNRNSTQSKLTYLVTHSVSLIEQLQNEEIVKDFIDSYWLLKVVTKNVEWLKYMNFLLACALNVLVLLTFNNLDV